MGILGRRGRGYGEVRMRDDQMLNGGKAMGFVWGVLLCIIKI